MVRRCPYVQLRFVQFHVVSFQPVVETLGKQYVGFLLPPPKEVKFLLRSVCLSVG